MGDVVDVVQELFDGPGGAEYLGEDVTVATHMVQTGSLAAARGAPGHLVVAALLHDVGHLVAAVSGRELMSGTDNHHDEAGARWLAAWFPPEVSEPVRRHVAAKRYLCAVDPAYRAALSPASVYTLGLQGGPFDPAEVARFEAEPYAQEAVAVRRWDDTAKDPDVAVPPFAAFADVIRAVSLPA